VRRAPADGEEPLNSQERFMQHARQRAREAGGDRDRGLRLATSTGA
jgi:hypothetical protein